MDYKRLVSDGQIGSIHVKNRMIMAPMGNNFGTPEAAISPRQLRYYEERAKGGVGLIITESAPVDPLGIHGRNRIQVYHPDAVVQLRRLSDMAHSYQCRIVLQLTHGGAKSSPELIGEYPFAPSAFVIPKKDYIPRQLTTDEITAIVAQYVKAAVVARDAGFDGVQILAASGHLVHQFLSAASNRRTDQYGGSLENRLRFLVEIIAGIQTAIDKNFPILIKMVGRDPENADGTKLTEEEWLGIATALDAQGVASLHFSTNYAVDPAADLQRILALAAKVKPLVKAQIAVAGSILTPECGEALLQDHSADFIELGRALIGDPDFPNKVMAGRADLIRPCLNCNRCRYETNQKRPIQCTVNPFLGREECRLPSRETVPSPKRVVIIGAGPAGIQAALCLSERGYQGTIYERGPQPGGLLWSASVSPGKERMDAFVKHLAEQVTAVGFAIEYNHDITPENLKEYDFSSAAAIIVACGATPFVPDWVVPGTPHLYQAADLLASRKKVTGDVVVLGGGQVGCETADYLSESATARVTLMVSSPAVAKNVYSYERNPLLKRLGEKGVRILINASPTAFDGVNLVYRHGGVDKTARCDAAVIAKGWQCNHRLPELLERQTGKKVFVIGDASDPRSLLEALTEGSQTAMAIAGGE